ncbi:MAG: hypothetical protein H7X71_08165 [Chitinophagales bacterium]|nr:hypothetical protein [Chitinophagales bacterium]
MNPTKIKNLFSKFFIFFLLLKCSDGKAKSNDVVYPQQQMNTTPGDSMFSTANSDSTKKKKKYKVDVEGMIQVHYFDEFNTNGDTIVDASGFRILRARLTAKGNISKNVSYVLMIDPRSPESRGILRDAYIDFHLLQNQKLRVGQQKTQFGYENRESSAELYFVNRTEVSDNLSRGANLRDIGLGLTGNIPLKNNFRIEDAITFTNGSAFNVTGPNDFSTIKNVWGRIGLRYKNNDLTWRLGLSGGKGALKDLGDDLLDSADDFIIKFDRIGGDIQFDHKIFFLATEYVMGNDNISDTISDTFGYYILLAGKTKWKIGPTLRYDVLDDEWKRWTAGVYYGLPKDKLRVLLNYEYRGYIPPDTLIGSDDRLYIQLQLVF